MVRLQPPTFRQVSHDEGVVDAFRAALQQLSPQTRRSLRLLPVGTVVMLLGVAGLAYALVTSHTDSGKIERLTGPSIIGIALVVVGAAICAAPLIGIRRRARIGKNGGTAE